MIRRSGSPTSLWNAAVVGASGTSNKLQVARGGGQICIYVSVSAITTVSLEVAHYGALTPEGDEPNASTPPVDASFMQLYYIDTPIQIAFAGAGAAALIVPDFEPAWIRLRSSGAATITAGHEITAD